MVINKDQTSKLLFFKKAFQEPHLKRFFYVQDERYGTRSQGWRCRDAHGRAVYRKEPGRRCEYVQDEWYETRSQGWRCCDAKGWIVYALLLVGLTTLPAEAKNACTTPLSFDETAKVRYIYDGDTLQLKDGRKVRLIGINTPELARKQKPAEAFADEAKQTLKALVKKGQSIHLIHGKDKKDHYGRTLAHTFLANGQNIQEVLISQGLASVITIPPNTKFAACYLTVENTARCNRLGLWKNKTTLKAKKLSNQHIGFQLIQGTVKDITTNAKGIWLNIDNTLTVGIRPDNRHLFDSKTINSYLNQSISIRGWLNKSRKSTPYYLRVKHPLSIQLSSTLSCH